MRINMWSCHTHNRTFIEGGYCPLCRAENERIKLSGIFMSAENSLSGVIWNIARNQKEHPERNVHFIAANLVSTYHDYHLEMYYTDNEAKDETKANTGVMFCDQCGQMNLRVLACACCGHKLNVKY